MLTITVKAREAWDDVNEVFVKLEKDQTLQLEHSLISISKWEAKHKKPYLDDTPKTAEETLDYVKCMTIGSNVDPIAYRFLTKENMQEITDYVNDPMTATKITKKESVGGKKSKMPRREILTSEVIYYYMTVYGINWEAQKWHLNRLLTVINVHSEKESPTKMSKKDIINRNSELNKMRRMAMGSKG